MKIKKFNENINIQQKIFYKRYSIYVYDDIEFLLQDSEYLDKCKIKNIIYYNYFEFIKPSHYTFKIYAFPADRNQRDILDKMSYQFLRHEDETNSLNKDNSWKEIEHDYIETIINSEKFNI